MHRVLADMEPHDLELRIHLCRQGSHESEQDAWGMRKTNEQLGQIRDGWVFLWADDAMPERPLFRRLQDMISANPSAGAFVFSQRRPGSHILHAHPDNMKPCHVDGGQVCWRRDFVGDDHYDRESYGDRADGHLIWTVFTRSPQGFIYCDEPLINFNQFV